MAVHVLVDDKSLNPEDLRHFIDVEGCGSIVTFVGLTRSEESGSLVKRLEFDAWEEELPRVLREIAEESISSFGIKSVVIAHRIGSVGPGDTIVCIHVGSEHRKEGFSACSWLISELKKQAPLWKKEIREDGEYWKSGLG
ncbi:MAG: molybdenum cofactor biosynthesis protein MoaE [Euryarchaeota archaeon]|nr:molybdenum cofactor biosynthesis protein MoaE [Euryarchaeota archaeon]|tara:strand:+ start:2220 stop:2639 length:420 start_codon:yes stop_codon:yes gene_type:complete